MAVFIAAIHMIRIRSAHVPHNGVMDRALHAHRLLLRAGLSMAHMFAWIFIFEYFYALSNDLARSLAGVVLLYALVQFVTGVLTPISAAHLRHGTRRVLIWGVIFAASAFVVLGATLGGYFDSSLAWSFALFAILLGAYRALYWIPYTLTASGIPETPMRAYLEVLIALMPLFAGLTVVSVPFADVRLLFGAAALIGLSALPVLYLSDTYERFSWPYMYTFSQLFRRKNHGLVLQSFLDGLQGAALFLVWPLAIFLILEASYIALGLVFTLTLLVILLLRRIYKRLTRTFNLHESPTVYTILVVSGWIGRLAAGTPLGVIVADSYAYVASPERGTYADPFLFEQASDRGSFVDEYTALKEIALAGGRIALCTVVFFLAFAFQLPVVFAIALSIAAAAGGISVLIARYRPAPTF